MQQFLKHFGKTTDTVQRLSTMYKALGSTINEIIFLEMKKYLILTIPKPKHLSEQNNVWYLFSKRIFYVNVQCAHVHVCIDHTGYVLGIGALCMAQRCDRLHHAGLCRAQARTTILNHNNSSA